MNAIDGTFADALKHHWKAIFQLGLRMSGNPSGNPTEAEEAEEAAQGGIDAIGPSESHGVKSSPIGRRRRDRRILYHLKTVGLPENDLLFQKNGVAFRRRRST